MFTLKQTDVFENWFKALRDLKAKDRIATRISRLADHGHFGDFKSLDENVSELRFHFGPGYRVYFTQRGETIILLLAGGDKSSQKRDIRNAIQLAKESMEDDN